MGKRNRSKSKSRSPSQNRGKKKEEKKEEDKDEVTPSEEVLEIKSKSPKTPAKAKNDNEQKKKKTPKASKRNNNTDDKIEKDSNTTKPDDKRKKKSPKKSKKQNSKDEKNKEKDNDEDEEMENDEKSIELGDQDSEQDSRDGEKDEYEISQDEQDEDDEEQEEENDKEEKGLEKQDNNEEEEEKEDNPVSRGPLFSDDNANWLKPKRKSNQLIESDDDEEEEEKGIQIQDDDDDDELLEVERQAKLLDEEMELERQEADAEMRRTIQEETQIFTLPTPQELEEDAENRVVPPSELKNRIESIISVLADFRQRRQPGRYRSEYTSQLVSDLAELYGYIPELVEYFLSMLGPNETLEFISASDQPRPLVIRTNTLKARRKDLAAALMKRGVTLDPLAPWSKVGLKIIESNVPIGATPEYLSGQYMLQSAASMCPVLALSPLPRERILDMSAAPGGKTSFIAQLMRNTGVVIANDLKVERQKATVANMHRLGVKNVITCRHDGRKLGVKFPNGFDRILLDAPCSGLGVISRDPSVKVQRTIADVQKCAHLQKELLVAAIDALNYKSKSGGVMVYSTCSVSVYENEEVVNYALQKRDIKLVDTGLDFGKPGFTRYQNKRFHPSVGLTRRFYPHVHNMDGFFVAKIQKLSDRKPEDTLEPPGEEEEPTQKKEENNKVIKRTTEQTIDQNKETAKRKEKSGISVPPVQKTKKRRLNAKVTKPRRRKVEAHQ